MLKDNKKLKFNIIDLIILLFVILAVFGIIYRYDIADEINFSANNEIFEIEFFIKDVRRGTEDYLQAGEIFHINIESTAIGTVKELIDVREAVAYVETSDGEIVRSTLPERVDISGIMMSRGRTTREGNIMLNGNIFITVGKEFFIHTAKREVWITVMNINPVN